MTNKSIPLMLCESVDSENEIPLGWYWELKLDGIRALYIDGRFITRQGNDITDKFPELKGINFKGVLDGEIVCFKNDDDRKIFKTDFNTLQNHKNNGATAFYVAFDVLRIGKDDITDLPLRERRDKLNMVVNGSKCPTYRNIMFVSCPSWNTIVAKGYEGIVAKNPDSTYEFRRSKSWRKYKRVGEIDSEILNYEVTANGNGFVINLDYNGNGLRVAVQNPIDRDLIKANFGVGGIVLTAVISFNDITKTGMLRNPVCKEVRVGHK